VPVGLLQVLPAMDQVIAEISRLAGEYSEIPMLCRTHGQTASPSTMGKEMAVFAYRLQRQRQQVTVITTSATALKSAETGLPQQLIHLSLCWFCWLNPLHSMVTLALRHSPPQ
jgi:hypothetical protein